MKEPETTLLNNRVQQSRFLKACRMEPVDVRPIWLMRQAGRYMPEYRRIRDHHSMLELINDPELAAEITMQPIEAFGLDAAIIFSDILPPLTGFGLDLEFVKGEGPVFANPLRGIERIERLQLPDIREVMGPTLEAITLLKERLEPRGIPLIGFSGAPFTLACYAIQGSGSKSFEQAKKMMYSHPAVWNTLMDLLTQLVSSYLIAQKQSGAAVLQVFDSWAGILSPADYEAYVAPFNRSLFTTLQTEQVPIINFSTGTGTYIEQIADCGGDVVGIDWRLSIDDAWNRIGREQAIQGNLDPTLLLADWSAVKPQVDSILKLTRGRNGHIFNLGHGVLQWTPVEMVRRLVDYVHEQTT